MRAVVTDLGTALMARALTEELDIRFPRYSIGSGGPAEGDDPRGYAGLVSPFGTFDVTAVRAEEGGCAVVCDFASDGGFPRGTPVGEVGVYARAGDEAAVLFAYAYDDEPETLPEGDYERRFVVHVAMGDDEAALAVTFNTVREEAGAAIAEVLAGDVEVGGGLSVGGLSLPDAGAGALHANAAGDVQVGVLPVSKGGTGQTSENSARNRFGQAFATCSTAGATAAKEAACDGFALHEGARVMVKFVYPQTTGAALKLKVGFTEAKEVCVNGALTAPTNPLKWAANTALEFVYDGTFWTFTGNVVDARYHKAGIPTFYYPGLAESAKPAEADLPVLPCKVVLGDGSEWLYDGK